MANKNKFLLLLIILVVMVTGCGGQVSSSSSTSTTGGAENGTLYTGNAILSWSAPTNYSDGNPLPSTSIKGYRVYSRPLSGAYNGIFYYVSAPTTSLPVKNLSLPVGQYYIVVTTLDISNIESSFSNEILADLK